MQFTRKHIIFSLIWKYLEQCSGQAVQFVISIILARLLMPEDFGIAVLITMFFSIANLFIAAGLNTALIQKKDADELDFSTVFWLSLSIAFFIYVILFFAAPLIASFYEKDILIPIIRISGVSLFISVFSSMQAVVVAKNLLFKKMFYRSFVVSIPTGIFGISLAYNGFGVWSLVWQSLFGSILIYIFMQSVVKWKPTFEFSIVRARKLFNFGYKLLLSSLLDSIYNNSVNLLIGKFFSPVMLAFYNRGEQFPKFIMVNVNSSIGAVLFPVLANVQNDIWQFKHKMRKSIKCSCFAIFPLMALLASSATPTVEFVLGEKWLPCVIFLQINCFIFALWPLHTTSIMAMNSLGKSDIFLKRTIVIEIVNVFGLVITLYIFGSPIAIVVGHAIISLIVCFFINFLLNRRLLNYEYYEQIQDIIPSFVLSLVCGLAVFPISRLAIPNFAIIILQVASGLSIYLFLAKTFKMESMDYFIEILKTLTNRGQNDNKNIREKGN